MIPNAYWLTIVIRKGLVGKKFECHFIARKMIYCLFTAVGSTRNGLWATPLPTLPSFWGMMNFFHYIVSCHFDSIFIWQAVLLFSFIQLYGHRLWHGYYTGISFESGVVCNLCLSFVWPIEVLFSKSCVQYAKIIN